MTIGRVALGLLSIGLGLNQIRRGANQIARPPARRPSAGRRPPKSRKTLVRPPTREHAVTPSGAIRLRTFRIQNLEERIHHLQQLVEQGKRDPVVYEFARRAVNKKCGNQWCVPEKNNAMEGEALFRHIRDNVRYTSDIAGIDSYQKAAHTISMGTADCDDYTVLACSAASTLGIPCRFKVIRTKGSGDWNHIYAQLGFPRRAPRKWVSFDASVEMPFGWEAPPSMVAASRVFPSS